MSVGANIRERREKAGLTQEYVAEQADVSQVLLCRIEKGVLPPSLRVIASIAKTLGCTVDDLLKDESA